MSGLFISYRRQDSAGYAARLSHDLQTRYGSDRVFLDMVDIAPGADFPARLHELIASSTSVLVVIGSEWLTATDATGQRRIDNPDDFIRTEVASALRSKKPVIPILVGGAAMPHEAALPEELRDLWSRQALQLGDLTWHRDLHYLYQTLDPLVGTASIPPPTSIAGRTAKGLSFNARLRLAFDVLMGRVDPRSEEQSPEPEQKEPLPAPPISDLVDHQDTNRKVAIKRVFVSHAEEDRSLADNVVRLLEHRDRPCWIAHRNIAPGTKSWSGPIFAAIADSRLFVVLVTNDSVSSKQVLREVTIADDEDIPLMPVCLDDVALSPDFKYFFAAAQRLELPDLPQQETVQKIASAVEGHLASN